MVRIIRTNKESEDIPLGFPMLISEEMKIIEPAFGYLLEIATLRGRTASPRTVQTYAEQLLDWFDTLEQNEIDWQCVSAETLGGYRRRHETAPSPVTGREYAPTTINARVRGVYRFYKWAAENHLIGKMPFPSESYRNFRAPKGFLGHTSQPGKISARNPLTLREPHARKRSLSVTEIQHLMAELKEPYETMAAWAVATGMRRMELCALKTDQIPNPMGLREREGKLVPIDLTVTKGDRPRAVYAPLLLIDRTARYIHGARRRAAKASRIRSSKHLFLGPRGAPVKPHTASTAFQKGFARAAVTGNLHCLRHTFAVRVYEALMKRERAGEQINVLMALRDLLGHSSVAVTETYLASLEMHPDTVEPTLEYLYGALVENLASDKNEDKDS